MESQKSVQNITLSFRAALTFHELHGGNRLQKFDCQYAQRVQHTEPSMKLLASHEGLYLSKSIDPLVVGYVGKLVSVDDVLMRPLFRSMSMVQGQVKHL